MRARVASEVDEMMDNGVRINPMLREMFGGESSASEAVQPSPQPIGLSPGGATKRKVSAHIAEVGASTTDETATEPAASAPKKGRIIVDSDDED